MLASLPEEGPPVRAVLVSRHGLAAWEDDVKAAHAWHICDRHAVPSLAALGADECVQLFQEVCERFASHYGHERPRVETSAIVAWHGLAPAIHGLPLFVSAAAIHAVLESQRPLSLRGGAVMRALAERIFGGWEDRAVPVAWGRASEIEPAQNAGARLAIVPREGAAQSELRIGHLSARRNTPDYPALLVMNSVLGGQFVSRVNLKLREEKGFTYGASTGFDWRRWLAPFSFSASVNTAATAEAFLDAHAELEGLRGRRPRHSWRAETCRRRRRCSRC
jgi:hypothetical protein